MYYKVSVSYKIIILNVDVAYQETTTLQRRNLRSLRLLKVEIARMWDMETEAVLVVIGALSLAPYLRIYIGPPGKTWD